MHTDGNFMGWPSKSLGGRFLSWQNCTDRELQNVGIVLFRMLLQFNYSVCINVQVEIKIICKIYWLDSYIQFLDELKNMPYWYLYN